jgi:MFS transporter, SHS family, lactate transporter
LNPNPSGTTSLQAGPKEFTLRDINATQWRAFLGAFLGWVLDGFDFSVLAFILIDIEHSFTVDKALAGALGTVTLVFRLFGGLGIGTAADRFGRKTPLMLSVVWISLFSLLSGLSISYGMLFACRALFGIGMGGVWAAGLPLALEHWPTNLRGVASGLLMGGFAWGYICAAVVYQFIYPLVRGPSGWRVLFFAAALPIFLVFWIRARVEESPIWLARQSQIQQAAVDDQLSIRRIFRRDLIGITFRTSVTMALFMFSYYSISFWYPTFLRETHLSAVEYVIGLNVGGIVGSALWGRVSESWLGRRGTITVAALGSVLVIPIFLGTRQPSLLLLGSFLMGSCGIGVWGTAPAYLTESFPTSARAVGPGFAYHAGAAIASLTPTLIGYLQDRSISLPHAMAACTAIAGVVLTISVWFGPETRGRSFAVTDRG